MLIDFRDGLPNPGKYGIKSVSKISVGEDFLSILKSADNGFFSDDN